ncbi:hypothetical protein AB0469_14630 [Streptomyces sp. NPDC093801]|uniref:hypothetical protein n=1 Tax=Streptomyces sp. NPDC093801 TaxID=3155203 RepID=UPI00344CB619
MGFDRKKEQGERDGKALPPRSPAAPHTDAAFLPGSRQVTRSSVQAVGHLAGNAAATAYVQRVTDKDGDQAEGKRQRYTDEQRAYAERKRQRMGERSIKRGDARPVTEFTTQETPFGPVNERPGRGGAPYVTTNQAQYPGTPSIDGRYVREEEGQYVGLIPTLDAEHFLPLAEALKGRQPSEEVLAGMSDEQRRAAAMIMGIANAEELRAEGSTKILRSTLRRQADPEHEAIEAIRDFAQGAPGGAQHEQRVKSGRTRRTTPEIETILEASSSSDDSTPRRRK